MQQINNEQVTKEVAELDLVFINDKEVMTDSLTVARYFERRHDNVMRGIKRILKETKDIPNALIFEEVSYIDQKGENRKKYVFGKDATILLVMGYTGEKAMSLKINYINAFNTMHEYILSTLRSKQEKHFEAVEKFETKKAEMSWHASKMRKWQDDAPLLLEKVNRTLQDMQESIDFAFTDDKKLH